MITAVVISCRENIDRCLRSLAFCDEVVVLKKEEPIKDFSKVRNEALKSAKNEWVLFVDDDEEVSDELENEILKYVQDDKIDGYFIPRKDFFFGKRLMFGETGNIKLLRLGRKNAGRWQRKVFEVWKIRGVGKVGEMREELRHYPHPTIFDFIKSVNFYSDIDAREFAYFNYLEVFFKPVGKFGQNYFLKLGFLDGLAGFVFAFMMSFQSLVVRVKQYDFFASS